MLITNQSKIWFPLTNSKMKPCDRHAEQLGKKDTIQYARFLKMCKDSFYKLLFKCDLAVGCSSRDIISGLYMPNLNTLLCLCSIIFSPCFSSGSTRYSLWEFGAGCLFPTWTVCRKRAYGRGGYVWWSAADEYDPCRDLQLQRRGVCACSCSVAAWILPFMHGLLH